MLIFLSAAAAVVTLIKILTASAGNAYYILLGNFLIYLMIMGMIFIPEQYEEKHKGYMLLATLPVKIREILAVKFILILISLTVYVSYLVLLSRIFVSERNFPLARSFSLLNGAVALLLAGVVYTGIFGLGYTKFTIVFLTFVTALGIVPMAIQLFADLNKIIDQFQSCLIALPWWWILFLVLGLYSALFLLSAKLKENRVA